jgi:hypothetical protein
METFAGNNITGAGSPGKIKLPLDHPELRTFELEFSQ